ncbi:MAG: sulfite exporter TauE/SafE family protein [Pelagibacteraceae bacterium]|nr:sulfite exporter TauE/SafE family protein [Pelagibacteraceae bacterium]
MAASAVLSGFVAGLFGIGGGLITVPVLFYIFSSTGLDQTFIMHLAVGTSFAIIIPTSIASTMTHIKFKGVDFGIVKTFGIFAIIGVILGTIFAASLKTASLVLFFSIITMFIAIYFLILMEKINFSPRKINLIYRTIFGFLSGFLSAPMGIGGGIINTPILKIFGYPINVAIGTSAAIGFLISLIGAIGFATLGSYLNINAPLSLGFVNVPAFLIFVPITTFMAKIGAKTVHKVNKKLIGKLFGIFLLFVSCRLFYEYFSF